MRRKILLLAIPMNVILMGILTFYLMKLPWLAGDEKFLIWGTSVIKYVQRDRPPSEQYALINTSYDLQLIDRYDEYGFPVGNQVITDRMKLSQLFRIINSGDSKPRYIICDINFVDSSRVDSILYAQLLMTDNLIASVHLNDDGTIQDHIFPEIKRGISDYVIGSVFDGIYKYQLIHNDSLKLLPLKVYEDLSGKTSSKNGPFVSVGDHWTLNNFIMDYRVLQKDIEDLEAGFNPVNLGELLYLPDEDVREFLKDKILIIGDFFEQDMHETIFEMSSGPLILLNAFMTISDEETELNFYFFLMMFVAYAFMSYVAFSDDDIVESRIKKITKSNFTKYLVGFTTYMVILSLFSITTFFLYNIHINVFFMAIAFYIVDRICHIIFYKN